MEGSSSFRKNRWPFDWACPAKVNEIVATPKKRYSVRVIATPQLQGVTREQTEGEENEVSRKLFVMGGGSVICGGETLGSQLITKSLSKGFDGQGLFA